MSDRVALGSGRVAVVTGGGSGMGEASALELARRGDRVAVLDVDEAAARRVAEAINLAGGTAIAVRADVADRSSVDAGYRRVRAELGPIEILVTSAGKVGFGKFTDISVEDWHRIVDINLNGTFHCCQLALPDMLAGRWGRIVMISSSSAQRGAPYMAHYAAAKGAVITLTRSLANEYAAKGITVNNIPPSSIDTPMTRQSQADGKLGSSEELAKRIPMGHLGTGEDIAAAVAYFCSEEAGFVTGQVLGVNGGAVI
ncbi:SDR family NAD(P)-dependent oxidoreductase [Mycolicibacterium fallax]|nr:SDR family NAD(P)-dependent oxidoreductase [Mycolicibacterium fallax]BBY96649.1 3-oxoacyl-ACP reductase [Mycolicibacterium fallax]